MKRINCFISSLISTILTHNGWWVSAHEYIEVGTIEIGDKHWQVLMCKKCNHLSKMFY